MIDVFVCTCCNVGNFDQLRWHLAMACENRWGMEEASGTVKVKVIDPLMIGCDNKQFQGSRRVWADVHSDTDVYIMTDDDVMPLGLEFIKRGLKMMEDNPEYTILTARLLPETLDNINELSNSQGIIDHPHITSGGLNFVRKGPVAEVLRPHMLQFFDDSKATYWLREKGYKIGVMRDVYANHIGTGVSTIWPVDYTGKTQIGPFKYK